MKDTCLLGVGYRSRAASCHVAVKGHLESVAVGCVVEKAAEEPSTSPSLHHVPVEGCVRLNGDTKTSLTHHDKLVVRERMMTGRIWVQVFASLNIYPIKSSLTY